MTARARHTSLLFCLSLLTACAMSVPEREIPEQRYSLDALSAPAEVLVDQWGVPHMYADTQYDAFVVQGFNAARDRLWQIDLWRRRGLGRLSEVLGEAYVEQDRATRLFLYRGDMYREWLAYGSDAKRIAEAFAAGVNAYIDLIESGDAAELLPPEFDLLGYRPQRWDADDIVRIRSHGLLRNVRSEVRRARIVCELGLDAALIWKPLEPDWTTQVPDGLDPCIIPDDVLTTYNLATARVNFDGFLGSAGTAAAVGSAETGFREGSNNWVVAPTKTSTGRPILADDPHRAHSVPSLRYISHLVAPTMNVIGAGEPALPGISIGHNERIAFGLTIFSIDQEDLYVYDKSADGYRYQGAVRDFGEAAETISVLNADPVEVTLRFTVHGPVIHETDTHVFAVRAGWLEPGMAPYFGSVEYMRATNWDEFLAALNRWGAPSENQVYADVDGNICYKPAGLFPRRPNWDGLMPVPGDGRYEWDGFFDMDVLPVEFNPPEGYTATANSMNLPDDYPIEQYPMAFEWTEPWRYDRIVDVLSAARRHSVKDSLALQHDARSLRAMSFIERIPASLTGPDVDLLRSWDGVMRKDSAAAALFIVWVERHLRPALASQVAAEHPDLLLGMDSRSLISLLDKVDTSVVAESLRAAHAELTSVLGASEEQWTWAALHTTRMQHPLLPVADDALAERMRVKSYPRAGSGETVSDTGYYDTALKVDHGASFSQVIDVGNWDASRATNTPGQSGDPRSPFYANLLEDWANERSFPLLYSRDAVERHTVLRIVLSPPPAR